jgi:hypothetical protein
MNYYTPYTSSIVKEMSLLSLLQNPESSFASPKCANQAQSQYTYDLDDIPDFALPPSICSIVETFKHLKTPLNQEYLIMKMRKEGLNDSLIGEVLQYRNTHRKPPAVVLKEIQKAKAKQSSRLLIHSPYPVRKPMVSPIGRSPQNKMRLPLPFM